MGKQRKWPSSLIFACIKKCDKNSGIFFSRTFIDPNKIEGATAFSLHMAHTYILIQASVRLHICSAVYTALYSTWQQPGLSRGLESKHILTN